MSSSQAIVAHLLEGREELVREVQRLTNAIAELDDLIGRLGGSGATEGLAAPASIPRAAASARGQVETRSAATAATRAPSRKSPAAKSDARAGTNRRAAGTGRPAAGRTVAGRATAARASTARSADDGERAASARSSTGEGPKSIRVHVLEMLSAENRDFGLAEIIDRIHGAGIDAHDDAVRSITIKLMKDGRVERVGRGQYRLTRRRSRSSRSSSGDSSSSGKEGASSAEGEGAGPDFAFPSPAEDAGDAATGDKSTAPAQDGSGDETAALAQDGPGDAAGEPSQDGPEGAAASPDGSEAPVERVSADPIDESDRDPQARPDEDAEYTPPLNLAEPWRSR